jgi:hypothetical protein
MQMQLCNRKITKKLCASARLAASLLFGIKSMLQWLLYLNSSIGSYSILLFFHLGKMRPIT